MALAKKQSRSSNIIVIAIVILVVAVIGYFAYTRFIVGNGTSTNGTNSIGGRSGLVNFDPTILNDPRVTNLQDYSRSVNADVNSAGQVEPFR